MPRGGTGGTCLAQSWDGRDMSGPEPGQRKHVRARAGAEETRPAQSRDGGGLTDPEPGQTRHAPAGAGTGGRMPCPEPGRGGGVGHPEAATQRERKQNWGEEAGITQARDGEEGSKGPLAKQSNGFHRLQRPTRGQGAPGRSAAEPGECKERTGTKSAEAKSGLGEAGPWGGAEGEQGDRESEGEGPGNNPHQYNNEARE